MRKIRCIHGALLALLFTAALAGVLATSASALTPGIAEDRAFMNPRTRPSAIRKTVSLGAKEVRLLIAWDTVHSHHAFHFAQLDAAIVALRKAGLQVRLTLTGTPSYGSGDTELSSRHPSTRLMHLFAYTVAKRYGNEVASYSIWNEPNDRIYLRNESPRTYRSLYDAGLLGVKLADPTAQILFGELCSCGGSGLGWLRAAIGDVPLRTDGLALHPYNSPWHKPNEDAIPGGLALPNLPAINSALARWHELFLTSDGTPQTEPLPIYVTEFGYHVDHTYYRPAPPALRAKRYRQAVVWAQSNGVRAMIFYELQAPIQATKQQQKWNTALIASSGTPTDSYNVLQSVFNPSH